MYINKSMSLWFMVYMICLKIFKLKAIMGLNIEICYNGVPKLIYDFVTIMYVFILGASTLPDNLDCLKIYKLRISFT